MKHRTSRPQVTLSGMASVNQLSWYGAAVSVWTLWVWASGCGAVFGVFRIARVPALPWVRGGSWRFVGVRGGLWMVHGVPGLWGSWFQKSESEFQNQASTPTHNLKGRAGFAELRLSS